MNSKDDMITIKKSTMMSILHLLSLAAFSMESKLNSICRNVDLGKTKEYQGENFTHDKNYDRINDDVNSLSKVLNLLFKAIPSDDESVSECVDNEISNNPEFKELLKYYGADLKDNFEKI